MDWNENPATRLKEWTKRLRSGDYPQGKGFLNRNGKFCCLGVACEMAVEAGVVEVTYDGVYDRSRYVPPTTVMKWLDIDPFGETVLADIALMSLNDDDDNLTFEQIADVIDAGLVKGFSID